MRTKIMLRILALAALVGLASCAGPKEVAAGPMLLPQSTATSITLGSFVDETDGFTAETGLTITSATVVLSKQGGALAAKGHASAAAHDSIGWYRTGLSTTDTLTLGRLIVVVHVSGARPVNREFTVVTSNIYNSLVLGTEALGITASGPGYTARPSE